MYKSSNLWCFNPDENIPDDFFIQVNNIVNNRQQNQLKDIKYLALLLWKRNIRTKQDLEHFFNPQYIHDNNSIFAQEIDVAVARLINGSEKQEKIIIWGDYSCDSIITTTILFTGLKNIFRAEDNQLSYYFSPRNYPKFGLNSSEIKNLADKGYKLIICAGMGSNNYQEINYANSLGLDIIIVDNTFLSVDKPPVCAWLNPHFLPKHHPDYSLSGGAFGVVAPSVIAFFLIKKLFSRLSENINLNNLLLLIALDLLQGKYDLWGNNRYLLLKGINLLKKEHNFGTQLLIEVCKRNGYHPLNTYQGISEKFNTLIGMYSNPENIINIITNEDKNKNSAYINKIEKAYFSYQDLNYTYLQYIHKQVNLLDLSNHKYLIFKGNKWNVNIINLVAKNTYNLYKLPVIILSNYNQDNIFYGFIYGFFSEYWEQVFSQKDWIIDYKLSSDGFSFFILEENITILTELISQKINNNIYHNSQTINIDLVLTIFDLNNILFQQIGIIEPYSINNPPVNIMLKNCNVNNLFEKKYDKFKGKSQNYTRDLTLEFWIEDDSCDIPFKAIWWGAKKDNLEKDKTYDIIGTIEYQYHFKSTEKIYYLRVIDLKPSNSSNRFYVKNNYISILDYRQTKKTDELANINGKIIDKCPLKWSEINRSYQDAIAEDAATSNAQSTASPKPYKSSLILAYNHPSEKELEELWHQFLTIIKLSLQGKKSVNKESLLETLCISDLSLNKICHILPLIGVSFRIQPEEIIFSKIRETFPPENYLEAKQNFQDIISQEYLQKEYFYKVKVEKIKEYLDFQKHI